MSNGPKAREIVLGAISDDAKAVAGAYFGLMHKGSVLSFAMREVKPSQRTQAALDELVSVGAVARDENRMGKPPYPVRYTPVLDMRACLAWLRANEGNPAIRFRMVDPIGKDLPETVGEVTFSAPRKRRLDQGNKAPAA